MVRPNSSVDLDGWSGSKCTVRLRQTIIELDRTSRQQGTIMIWLTVVLVVLTIVLGALPVVLLRAG
jgi:hypothetical protein